MAAAALGLAVVTMAVVLVGPAAVKSEMYWSILMPAEMLFYWGGSGLVLFLSGRLVSVIFIFLTRCFGCRTAGQVAHQVGQFVVAGVRVIIFIRRGVHVGVHG